MAYGILKVDTVTFTNDGVDKSITLSGLVQNPVFSGNVTVTGTLSGVTVTGTTANFTSGNFTNISGGIHTITSGVFAAGSAASPSITFTGDLNTGIYSPGADQVAISTGGSGRLFVDASGNVSIGASSTPSSHFGVISSSASVFDIYRTATGEARLTFWNNNTSSTATICGRVTGLLTDATAGSEQGALVFQTTTSGAPTEKVRITSDRYIRLASGTGGIQFNGDTAAANALDDYEEGTFTPVIIGSTTTGTATYSSQNGKYTKVGNRVFWEIYIAWTGGTGAGDLRVSGLPFTVSNTLATFPAASIGYAHNVTISADHQLLALQASNNTYVYFYQIPSGGGANVGLAYDASGTLGLSGNYNVA